MADGPISYQVTDLSPLYYGNVVASPRSVRSDIPGESISWLLESGHILPCADPSNPPLPVENLSETPEVSEKEPEVEETEPVAEPVAEPVEQEEA